TTMPPTNTPRCAPGWPGTRAGCFISRPPPVPGPMPSKPSSPRSRAGVCNAASSARWSTSKPRSTDTSASTTASPSRSSGPPIPTASSTNSIVGIKCWRKTTSAVTIMKHADCDARREWGRKAIMTNLSRRSVLRGSLGFAAASGLARPHVANAAATTAEVWWNQGFAPEEDVAFKAMVADYEKASGNAIDFTIVPNAPLRQKEVSAITSGVVPDVMEVADFRFAPLNVWDNKLLDISDVVEPQTSHFSPVAVSSCHLYANVTKHRR